MPSINSTFNESELCLLSPSLIGNTKHSSNEGSLTLKEGLVNFKFPLNSTDTIERHCACYALQYNPFTWRIWTRSFDFVWMDLSFRSMLLIRSKKNVYPWSLCLMTFTLSSTWMSWIIWPKWNFWERSSLFYRLNFIYVWLLFHACLSFSFGVSNWNSGLCIVFKGGIGMLLSKMGF
jgi:hypothetical protein